MRKESVPVAVTVAVQCWLADRKAYRRVSLFCSIVVSSFDAADILQLYD